MRKEFGKWLLDISKYLVTAVFISNIFSEMKYNPLLIFVGIGIILLTFIIGMIMVDDTENKKKSNIKKK
ncbi:DUF6722 family protein [Capnocytophaga sp. ARDL2]|uniref:DUF6722 family protein n=1 Tax=Capnocytophaga sp. ARDL2 TaxID=3238809 RepID=UPI003558892E